MQEKATQDSETSQTFVIWYEHPLDTDCTNPVKPQKSTNLQGSRSSVFKLAQSQAPSCPTCKRKLSPDLRVRK
ncbi:hypothetical protein A3A46_04370 [Candidatus Roizmanbacteria bacterium RIFCSPLOWO2_01_FULL_37_13]|uniref:Uncharacterized protein n=1 Tax=Candidatus Roizmanbacteria bacterium RIFCSPHIGHO2_02_FULL_38_11 TaxID=1802039 RepID=A0A1F7GXF7_9BACT|nr:MAG: hypothetical protein A3C25_05580 [Candidatus Roizmanbacteria bacterium RIFCSPHIGHO2_02_FULL_38_11]OGK34566.1 MAG: hypothetical protein A3F58_01730 [Candidatus Roizmanbacteria bacterium RIFCSPHIGHO2_12_FULL_37_9b]OGK43012.1 MAG: hypothetical protein A3A46_04370 [Candidatus Roizmanbacteria bacterium RIFCSPLOWO2_01_FULL_37_13]